MGVVLVDRIWSKLEYYSFVDLELKATTIALNMRGGVVRQVAPFHQGTSAATYRANRAPRVAQYQMKVGYGAGNNCAHSNHRKAANYEVTANPSPGANGGAFTHTRWQGRSIGGARSQFRKIIRRCAGELVICENHSGANHYAVFNRDCIAYIDHGVDFHSMADLHIVGDVGFSPDDALFTQTRSMANMDVIPNGRATPQGYVLFNDSSRVNSYIHLY